MIYNVNNVYYILNIYFWNIMLSFFKARDVWGEWRRGHVFIQSLPRLSFLGYSTKIKRYDDDHLSVRCLWLEVRPWIWISQESTQFEAYRSLRQSWKALEQNRGFVLLKLCIWWELCPELRLPVTVDDNPTVFFPFHLSSRLWSSGHSLCCFWSGELVRCRRGNWGPWR